MGTPILAPARFVRFGAHRIEFSPTCRVQDLALRNTQFYKRIAGFERSLVGQEHIVYNIAALVGIALDRERHVRISLQPLGIVAENRLIVRPQISLIEVEVDISYIRYESLLFISSRFGDRCCCCGTYLLHRTSGFVLSNVRGSRNVRLLISLRVTLLPIAKQTAKGN